MTQSTFSISASVLLPDGSLQPGTVYFTDGRIQRVAPGRDPGADLHSDGLLAPGLIDLQVNGAYGCDFTVDAASISTAAARLPETGVTAFLPTIITSAFAAYPERLRHVAQAMRRADGAQVLGAHLEGPYMNPQRKGGGGPPPPPPHAGSGGSNTHERRGAGEHGGQDVEASGPGIAEQ
jgi:N-acetylglucosamine-6-phosphate deacetylase